MAVMPKNFLDALVDFFVDDPQNVIATLEMAADDRARNEEEFGAEWVKIQRHLAQARRSAKGLY